MSYTNRYCYGNNTAIRFSIEDYPKPYDTMVNLSITSSKETPESIYLNIDQAIDYFKTVVSDLESYKITSQTKNNY